MTDLLTAARQALPGLTWGFDSTDEDIVVADSPLDALWIMPDHPQGFAAQVGDGDSEGPFDTTELAAQWLRAQVTARRDALDAALGEPKPGAPMSIAGATAYAMDRFSADLEILKHSEAADLANARADAAEAKLKAVAAAWPAHYHRQGCPWGMCNCGADAANAVRAEARRLCGVDNG